MAPDIGDIGDIGENDIPFSADMPLDGDGEETLEDGREAVTPDGDTAPRTMQELLGAQAAPLTALGRRAADVFGLSLESVVAQKGVVRALSAGIAQPRGLVTEFTGADYFGVELRLALSETEAHPLAVLIRFEDMGHIFTMEMSNEQMSDEAFAQGQVEVVSAGLKELLDLAGLMLFIDELGGGEVMLTAVRMRGIEETLETVQGGAQGTPLVRAEVTMDLPDGSQAEIVVLLPGSLILRLGTMLASPTQPRVDPLPSRTEAPQLRSVGGGEPAPERPQVEMPSVSQIRMPGGRTAEPEASVHSVRFPPLSMPDGAAPVPQQFDLIMDVPLRVSVELGRSSMTVEDVLALGPGSVVELDKLAGEPVDVLVNDRLIARGEVVVVDENFGVRVTEVLSPRTRAQALAR